MFDPNSRLLAVFFVLCAMLCAPLPSSAAAKSSSAGDQTFNVRVSPFGLIVGWVNVDADIRIGDFITVGPSLTYFNLSASATTNADSSSVKATRLGVRGNYFGDGVFTDSWYVSPILAAIREEITVRSGSLSASATPSGLELSLLGGYHWFWENGFNLCLGGGVVTTNLGNTTKITYSDGTTTDLGNYRSTGVALDFMLGWAF